jgi:PAS domain S-box-containing protein
MVVPITRLMLYACSMVEDIGQATKRDDQVFYEAFKASPIGIALEDLEGRPLFVSPALCSMLGFTETELCGKHCVEFSPPEDAEQDWSLFQQLRAGHISQYSLEKRFFRKDGSLIWGRLSISMLRNRSSPLVVAMVEDITEKKAAQDKLRQSEANLQNLAGHLILVQEEERHRIARDLHDDINQKLAMLQIDLERLEQQIPDSADQFRHGLHEQWMRVSEISSDVRTILQRLHPTKLQYVGLVATTKNLCRELSARHQVEIDFSSDNIPQEPPLEVSVCIFRVFQEALQNAIRHSGSRQFRVSLNGELDEIHLKVSDSGTGFDLNDAMDGKGLGLTSMRERLRLVDGRLSISSQPQHGTTVCARVPLRSGLSSS